jgi:hypothetical protein
LAALGHSRRERTFFNQTIADTSGYQEHAAVGVVTLSQIERNSPITANANVWDFNHLGCCSIAEIRLASLDEKTPIIGSGSIITFDLTKPLVCARQSRKAFIEMSKTWPRPRGLYNLVAD